MDREDRKDKTRSRLEHIDICWVAEGFNQEEAMDLTSVWAEGCCHGARRAESERKEFCMLVCLCAISFQPSTLAQIPSLPSTPFRR